MGLFHNDAWVISSLLIIAMAIFTIRRQRRRIKVKDKEEQP